MDGRHAILMSLSGCVGAVLNVALYPLGPVDRFVAFIVLIPLVALWIKWIVIVCTRK